METKDIIALVLAVVAILTGLVAIIKLVVIKELVVGVLSLTFGIMAIIWTYRARKSLSKGSELRKYTDYFILCLIAILFFSIWDTFLTYYQNINLVINEAWIYPKYLFITSTYLIFLRASYQILYLSKKFGFSEEASDIKKILDSKKKKSK